MKPILIIKTMQFHGSQLILCASKPDYQDHKLIYTSYTVSVHQVKYCIRDIALASPKGSVVDLQVKL